MERIGERVKPCVGIGVRPPFSSATIPMAKTCVVRLEIDICVVREIS